MISCGEMPSLVPALNKIICDADELRVWPKNYFQISGVLDILKTILSPYHKLLWNIPADGNYIWVKEFVLGRESEF